MTETSVREAVRDHYAERARQAKPCCGPELGDYCCDPAGGLYPVDLVEDLPEDVTNFSLGCGDPITLAALQAGQTVLDLGSGGGLDCFLAAKKVGQEGHVIGVDMTREMIAKARANGSRMNVSNVEFRQGYLEDLPVEDESIDVVISNCVINLSPDKGKVFSEVYRVLAPGGKLAVSDIVTDGPLPQSIKESLSAWAGCVAGAVEANEYVGLMDQAGFQDISIQPEYFDRKSVDLALEEVSDETGADGISQEDVYKAVYSARITARKP